MDAIIPMRMTAKERKALRKEIDKQLADNVRNMSSDLTALVLWELHEQERWGKIKLLRFQKRFQPMIKQLQDYYQVRTADDTNFICKHRLKNEVGIDVDELDAIFEFEIVDKSADKNKR